MLINSIDEAVTKLEEYLKIKEISDNKKIQDDIEKKFNYIMEQYENNIKTLTYFYQKICFVPSENLQELHKEAINIFKKIAINKKSDEKLNTELNNQLKKLTEILKKDWFEYYKENSNQLISILKTIIEITPNKEQTKQIINCLENGKRSVEGEKIFDNYIRGLNDGKNIIKTMEIEPYILEFLRDVNDGKMTLDMVTKEVYDWIKKEGLENRFRIQFYI